MRAGSAGRMEDLNYRNLTGEAAWSEQALVPMRWMRSRSHFLHDRAAVT